MKQALTAFKIVIPFILGILFASYVFVPYIILFTLWGTVLIGLLTLIYTGRKQHSLKTSIGGFLMLTFFFSGALAYAGKQKENQLNHYTNFLLPSDQIIVKIEEWQLGKNNFDKAVVEVEAIINDHHQQKVEGKLLCYIKKNSVKLGVGDRIVLSSELNGIKNKNNPGEFDQEKYWKYKGIQQVSFVNPDEFAFIETTFSNNVFWDKLRKYFKQQLKDKLDENNYAVATALSLGDKGALDKETRDSFANAGAMHVLAVSGLHVGILLGIIQWICFQIPLLRKRNFYIFIAITVIWCFAFLTGLSPSVFRASLMFTILAIGQTRGAQFFSMNGLLISALILLIIDPFFLFDIGFQLSYLAMLGILLFYRSISNAFHFKWKWLRFLWDGTAIGIAAQIGTLPISLYYFHQFPNYFIITNIGLMLLAGIALGSVLLFFVTHAIPYVSDLVAQLVTWVFDIVLGFVKFIDYLPFSVAKGFDLSFWQVIIAYLLIIGIWHVNQKGKTKQWYLVSACVFIFATGLTIQKQLKHNDNQLIVLNNRYQIILWKKGDELICFYDHNAVGKEDKIQFDVDAYHKKVGGAIHYFPIPSSKKDKNSLSVEINNEKIKIHALKNSNELLFNNKKWVLPYKNIKPTPQTIIIKGAWGSYYKNKVDIDATKNAVYLMG